VFLDAGHGGIDPETGSYTTGLKKMFTHKDKQYHRGGDFYEGVKNRLYCDMIADQLEDYGVNVIKVYHEYEDTPLHRRVNIANQYNKDIQPGIYLSEHSNAISNPLHNAKGLSVYTSKGYTQSDELSTIYGRTFRKDLDGVTRYRMGQDGQYDHEENFYVLRKTDMPAVLFENLFFDNPEDADKLHNKSYAYKYVNAFVDATIECLEYMEEQDKETVKDVD
jgi:N-acetylmuramoyl-L-alanine amidase